MSRNAAASLYGLSIGLRQTAATSANTTVLAMRNDLSSTKIVIIRSIALNMAFDSATPLGRATLKYYLQRFSGATPTGGGSQTPAKYDSTDDASAITDARGVDTGLSMAGVSFGDVFANIWCPAVDGARTEFKRANIPIALQPGEGLCFRLGAAAVAGQSLSGEIIWGEYEY